MITIYCYITTLDLCRSYLHNRKQYVEMTALSSDPFKFITYVDDTTLTNAQKIFKDSEGQTQSENINKELTKISNWLKFLANEHDV